MVGAEEDGSVVDRIADELRNRLGDAAAYPSGKKLPTEAELVEQTGAGRNSVRSAIDILEREGLVLSRRGSGVYARGAIGTIVRDETKRSGAQWWGAGHSLWELDLENRELTVDSMTRTRVPAPEPVEAILGAGMVWRRYRRYLVERRPVLISTLYVPADIADGTPITEADTGPGGVPARLSDAGHAPAGGRWQLRQVFADKDQAALLEVPRRFPLWEMVRIYYDAAGRAVEVSELIMDPTVFVLQFDSQL